MSEEFNNVSMYQEPSSNGNGSNGLAVASMVVGILSLVFTCCFTYVGIVMAIIGIVLGVMNNKNNGKNGMATAGIVCSIIALVLGVVAIVLSLIFGARLMAALSDLESLY